tara:strand:- start:1770 stop:2867 length:1098 start_codon:yes stop_codon:yes gene_type:complete
MKILQVPYANKIPLFSKAGTIPGGLEKVIHNVHKLLLSRGYDCHVIDAEGSYWDAPNVHKIMTESPIETNKRIIDFIYNNDIDVIINHGRKSFQKNLNKESMKNLFIDHSGLDALMKLYDEECYTTTWENAKKLGTIFIGVSQTQIEARNQGIQKQMNSDFQYDDWCKFQFVEEELNLPVLDPEGYAFAVARADKVKELHLMEKFHHFPYQCCTSPYHREEQEAHQKYMKRYEKFYAQDNVHWNLPRPQVIDKFRKANLLVSTWYAESAGITAFESLSYGVPVVLNEKKFDHASRFFAPEGNDYVCTLNETDKMREFFDYDLEKRRKISEEVREYNSQKMFLNNFVPFLEKVQQNNNTNSVLNFL